MQSIPCGWINPDAKIVIGRGALLNMKQFMKELVHILTYYPDFMQRLYIDEAAGILDEKYHEEEGGTHGEMHQKIGSTGEGVGVARIARIKRDGNFKLFRDVAEEYGLESCMVTNTPSMLATLQDGGFNILIEGTQGSGLSLLHSHYPYCTSVDTNASGIIAEVGIAPSRVTDVLMVVRTYPIRVAGNSGYMKNEISWEELNKRMGVAIEPEHTTVTKKIRRIAEWDDELFRQSVILNAPTEIALTFADYIDPSITDTTNVIDLLKSDKVKMFISKHLPTDIVRYIGTGAKTVVDVKEGTTWA
jgi:adenylosuccinate synthase